jgi:hypothetical protein
MIEIDIESTKNSWFQEQMGTTAEHELFCRNCLKEYIETRNPISAYDALHHWCLPQLKLKPESFPLPTELAFFLLETTYAILGLREGLKPLEYRDGKAIKPRDGHEIKASEACDLLPEALRLRGYKWNAFTEKKRDTTGSRLSSIKSALRKSGMSEREALEFVLRLAEISDERTLRRKVAGGRGPRQKSPYPAPKWFHEISEEKAKPPPLLDPKKAKAGRKEKKAGAKKP